MRGVHVGGRHVFNNAFEYRPSNVACPDILSIMKSAVHHSNGRTELLAERLRDAEHAASSDEYVQQTTAALYYALASVRNSPGFLPDGEKPIIADLHVDKTGYEHAFKALRTVLEGRTNPTDIQQTLDQNSLLLLVGLTGYSMTNDASSYWQNFSESLGLEQQSWFEDFIRDNLSRWLRRHGLNSFESVDLRQAEYFARINLNAGITARDAVSLSRTIRRRLDAGDAPESPEAYATFLSDNTEDQDAPWTIRNLFRATPKRAKDIVCRLYEVVEAQRRDDTWLEGFEEGETNGLPEPVFKELTEHLATKATDGSTSNTARRVPRGSAEPYVQFDLENLTCNIVLPPVRLEDPDDFTPIERTLLIDNTPRTVRQRRNLSSHEYEALAVNIDRPVRVISEVFDDEKKRIARLQDKDSAVLWLSRNGKIRSEQKTVGGSSAVCLLRPGTKVFPPSSTTELGEVQGWPGWILATVDGSGGSISITRASRKWKIPVRTISGPSWNLEGCEIANLVGQNDHPVLGSIPTITFPQDRNSWEIEYFYRSPEGTEEKIAQYTVEDDVRGIEMPILDAYDNEAWVGVFFVKVFKNKVLYDTTTLNLAEGLNAKLNYEGTRRFRVLKPGSSHTTRSTAIEALKNRKLSDAYVEFTSSMKPLNVPSGSKRTTEEDGKARTFTISTPGYASTQELTVKVKASAMSTRISRIDDVTTWTSAFQVLNFESIDPNGSFTVKFPQRVYKDVTLQVARMGKTSLSDQKSYRLSPATTGPRGTHWTISLGNILPQFDSDSSYIISVSWYDESPEEYARRHNPAWKKRRKTTDLRPTPAPVPIALITRRALLASVSWDDRNITASFGRSPMDDVRAKAWKVLDPMDPPTDLQVEGQRMRVPDDLHNVGPLVVELHEVGWLDSWEPSVPSPSAKVADNGSISPWTMEIPNRWMYLRRDVRLNASELRSVWEYRHVLDPVLGDSNQVIQDFKDASGHYLRAQPRPALNVLSSTTLTEAERLHAFISSGLVLESFASDETGGDIHPTPWVGLLQEANDVETLARHGQAHAEEYRNSRQYLQRVGGQTLWHMLSGEKDASANIPTPEQLADITTGAVRVEENLAADSSLSDYGYALAQARRARANLRKATDLREFDLALQKDEDVLGMYNLGSAYRATTSLRELGETNNEDWLLVPYISYVSSLLARLIAHGVLEPLPWLESYLPTWSFLARHAPDLIAHDLVHAEAAVINSHRRPGYLLTD